jgi:ribosomal protein S18 acetylase RimI-like enzyme
VIEVRRVRPEEYTLAGEITASAWEPAGSLKDQGWLSFRARIADVAGRDAVAAVYIATEDARVLGSVTLETGKRVVDEVHSAALAVEEAHVRVLGVAPEVRRRGVGRLLMSHCADVSRQNGKIRLTSNTSLKNVRAQNFYESIGYTRLSESTRYCRAHVVGDNGRIGRAMAQFRGNRLRPPLLDAVARFGIASVIMIVLSMSTIGAASAAALMPKWSAPVLIGSKSSSATQVTYSISCPSSKFCVTVNGDGQVLYDRSGVWSTPQPLAMGGSIDSVSCSNSTFCVAVAAGEAAIYNGH